MSNSDVPWLSFSTLDEERFGFRSARATLTELNQVAPTMEFCRTNRVVFLTVRCAVDAHAIVHTLEGTGFSLMDTLIYYHFDLRRTQLPDEPDALPIRSVRHDVPSDVEGVREVAVQAFHNYSGHYHSDPRLPTVQCDEVYVSWATRSCSPEVADNVLVAERDGQIVGFSVLKQHSVDEGEWQLCGVSPAARGLGLYRSFAVRTLKWFRERGAQRVITSTQITNFASQHLWGQLGLVPDHAFYTFHRWFD